MAQANYGGVTGPLAAYLAIRDQNAQGSNQDAQAQMQQATGLMALMQHAQAQKQQQQIAGIMAGPAPLEEKIKSLSGVPGGDVVASRLIQLAQHQTALTEAQKLKTFNEQTLPTFMNPGQPAQPGIQSVAFQNGQGPDRPAVAPSFDIRGALEAKVKAGLLDPLAYQKELDSMGKPVAIGRSGLAAKDASGNWNQVVAPPQNNTNQSTFAKELADAGIQPGTPEYIKAWKDRIQHQSNPQAQRIIMPHNPQVIQSAGGIGTLGPNNTFVPVTGADGKPVMPQASARIDLSQASQLQRQFNQLNKPMAENLVQVGMYDNARQSGDTAQAAVMAASALRQASRSNNRALKGDIEKLLGTGYGSGTIYDRVENFISNELAGSPSNNTLSKIDKLIRSTEDANLSGIAVNLNNAANQARGRNLPLANVAVPYQRGAKVAFPDGNVATFQNPQAAQDAINKWIEANQ